MKYGWSSVAANMVSDQSDYLESALADHATLAFSCMRPILSSYRSKGKYMSSYHFLYLPFLVGIVFALFFFLSFPAYLLPITSSDGFQNRRACKANPSQHRKG